MADILLDRCATGILPTSVQGLFRPISSWLLQLDATKANMSMGAFLVHQASPWQYKLFSDLSACSSLNYQLRTGQRSIGKVDSDAK